MITLCFRVDSRTFMRLFVAFNVLLAVYNILSFRVTPSESNVPCTLLVSSTSSSQQDRPKFASLLSESQQAKNVHVENLVANGSRVYSGADPGFTTSTANLTSEREEVVVTRRGKYLVIPNYAKPERTFQKLETVTLTTQGTAEYLHHASFLCKRWGGPVSVAVYAASGGDELTKAMEVIKHLRLCAEPCVRQNVSFHFVLDSDARWPVINETTMRIIPNIENRGRFYASPPPLKDFDPSAYNCTAKISPLLDTSSWLTKPQVRKPGRGYPINVARNVARSLATTHYVLASDIELYPSTGIIPKFLRLVASESQDEKSKLENKGPHVYVLPIFEVNKGELPPETKTQLVSLLKAGRSVYFHKWTCDACQNFPGRDIWANSVSLEDELKVHKKTSRSRARNSWEPIYIGTNADPFYEEGLTWEGKRDKMSQMFELCLMGYSLYILDNAFLVHAPGIKTINRNEERRRAPFMNQNNLVFHRAISNIKKNHPSPKHNC